MVLSKKILNAVTELQKRHAYKRLSIQNTSINTLRTGSFKLFKSPFPGFLTILTL